jgi:superfamily II DNA helicase RecQ
MQIKTFKIRLDDQLLLDEQTLNQFTETVRVKKTFTEFVPDQPNYWSILICYEEKIINDQDSIMGAAPDKISFPSETPLSNEEGVVYNALKQWRNDLATKTRLQTYMICHNSELVTIAKTKPKTLEDLARIKGFSTRKVMKYGDDVLALLNSV